MTYRVEPADVREIIDIPDKYDLTPYILTANVLTNRVSAADSAGLLDASILTEIEKYLAAYFAEHRHQQYSSESRSKASATFMGQTGMGLSQNKWGQTAIMLDETGFLKELSEGTTECSIEWLGLPPSEQTDYVDRD